MQVISSSSAQRYFKIKDPKPNYDEHLVSILISKWLGTESISAVTFTAFNIDTGVAVTSTVIDTAKCTFTDTVIKPFIQAGTDGETYVVYMDVATNGSPVSKGRFFLEFSVDTNIPKLGD